jgi:threonine synthase
VETATATAVTKPVSDADMICPRCEYRGSGYTGCPRCAEEGLYVNYILPLQDLRGRDLSRFEGGPWGWRDTLPLAPTSATVTLGEGDTPCFPLETTAGDDIWLKNEGANPTWSHKDRAACVAVAKALELGATTVVAPSTGNAGLATAAYAARAGLRAVILTLEYIPPSYQALMASIGASLVAFKADGSRYDMAMAAVEELGWYPVVYVDPRVGGNPYGNTGYRSVAYELARDFGDELAAVVAPTARADLLSGIACGFEELVAAGLLSSIPRLVAAEVDTGAAFSTALALDDPDEQDRVEIERGESAAFSIGSERAHWQGLRAIRISGGWAVSVDQETFLAEQSRVATETGLVIEAAAAVSVAAARKVAKEVDGVTVAMSTGAGSKDPVILSRSKEPLTILPADPAKLAEFVESRVMTGASKDGHR